MTNVLGLQGEAEAKLLSLAMAYESITGQHIRIRKNPASILQMLKYALRHDDQNFKTKAEVFIQSLPPETIAQLAKRGIAIGEPS